MSWPIVTLAEVGDFRAGFGFPNKFQGKLSGEFPFAKVGDISAVARKGEKYISTAGNYLDAIELKEVKAKPVPRGAIVFAKIGEAISQNFRAITAVEMLIDNNAMALVPDSEKVDTDYLYHFMCKLDLYRYAGATTVPSLRKSVLEGIEIPLPPLPEQKRIAAILDKADALRRKRQQAIQLADDFLRAVFLDMFGDPVSNPKGWPKKSLKLLGKSATGRTPPGEKVGMWGEGLPFVTPGDLCGKVDSSVREVTREGAEYSKICRKGSLLVCCIGTVGKVGIAGRSLAFNQQINAQEWGSEISDIYGFFVFKLSPGLVSSKAIQTTLPILKKSLFDEIEIPVPPIGLQEKFSAIAQKVSESSLRHESGLNTSLFESLSQLAFSGQL